LLAVDLARGLITGTVEHALNHLPDREIDLSGFDKRFNNVQVGAAARLRILRRRCCLSIARAKPAHDAKPMTQLVPVGRHRRGGSILRAGRPLMPHEQATDTDRNACLPLRHGNAYLFGSLWHTETLVG
jgi:hypothetical protein